MKAVLNFLLLTQAIAFVSAQFPRGCREDTCLNHLVSNNDYLPERYRRRDCFLYLQFIVIQSLTTTIVRTTVETGTTTLSTTQTISSGVHTVTGRFDPSRVRKRDATLYPTIDKRAAPCTTERVITSICTTSTTTTPCTTSKGYVAPGYEKPGYVAPAYNTPGYVAPGDKSSPSYVTPGYVAPPYDDPYYDPPGYDTVPGYEMPSYQTPGPDAPPYYVVPAPNYGPQPAYGVPVPYCTGVPSYVPPCRAAAYTSACKCWGVVVRTTTSYEHTSTVTTSAITTAPVVVMVTQQRIVPSSTRTVFDSCPTGYGSCNNDGSCVQTTNNTDHCGACGNKCSSWCENSACAGCSRVSSCSRAGGQFCGDGTCICAMNSEGQRKCVASTACQGAECEASSDCPSGYTCIPDTCCGDKPRCMVLPDTCPNGQSNQVIIAKRMSKRSMAPEFDLRYKHRKRGLVTLPGIF
ncbi:hypothetical protein DRE_03278 [Drechslerella stenobrocha 248]|uniref:4Fe-4S ferredoxin-type domain-containing protein n=1 Tax=Drechslerella stenobrocha 248 TaxID=1043628 RepID=W7I670_9PEZI|nr:hypothetical protein DRE_03278 [Drechslerella stenobrocha 248]